MLYSINDILVFPSSNIAFEALLTIYMQLYMSLLMGDLHKISTLSFGIPLLQGITFHTDGFAVTFGRANPYQTD